MPYRVGRNPSVNAEIAALALEARKLGIFAIFEEALLRINNHLANGPLEFGDPEYRMNSVNGIICHAVCQPLLVRYAVFEAQEIVHILEIKAFPGSVFFSR